MTRSPQQVPESQRNRTHKNRLLGLVGGITVVGMCLCGMLVLLTQGLYLDRLHQ